MVLKSIVDKAYWPIYGDMKIFDDFDKFKSTECLSEDTEGCPDISGLAFSYVALMIYMVIANLLLINLLIAMFR